MKMVLGYYEGDMYEGHSVSKPVERNGLHVQYAPQRKKNLVQ